MAKVLIIEDEEITRTVIKKIVHDLGHETVEAVNGHDGIEKISTEKPDVVLTDLVMPEMDGTLMLSLLHVIHSRENVIVVSANLQNAIKEQLRELGVSSFFGKPPDKEELADAINEILNKEK